MPVIKYGEHEIDTDKLPAKSVEALFQRGVTHFLGNEQASKVAAKFKDEPNATDADKAAFKAECVANAVKALQEGTIGARAVGPRGSTVDTIMRRLAGAEVKVILGANGIKQPKGDAKVEFSDGTKLSMAELIDRRLAHAEHGPRIRKEAEAEMKKTTKAAGGAGLDALL